ncbi:hypothetical protein R3P38DRAFT_3214260 [Favolaschia claudopus]|uniref:Uncharacterized protein n=1 Tax=Favolaschia claudopus TaxID=2862362 RepID=A0AAW0ABE7_9AGAR
MSQNVSAYKSRPKCLTNLTYRVPTSLTSLTTHTRYLIMNSYTALVVIALLGLVDASPLPASMISVGNAVVPSAAPALSLEAAAAAPSMHRGHGPAAPPRASCTLDVCLGSSTAVDAILSTPTAAISSTASAILSSAAGAPSAVVFAAAGRIATDATSRAASIAAAVPSRVSSADLAVASDPTSVNPSEMAANAVEASISELATLLHSLPRANANAPVATAIVTTQHLAALVDHAVTTLKTLDLYKLEETEIDMVNSVLRRLQDDLNVASIPSDAVPYLQLMTPALMNYSNMKGSDSCAAEMARTIASL